MQTSIQVKKAKLKDEQEAAQLLKKEGKIQTSNNRH
jgi:hypothetical protein